MSILDDRMEQACILAARRAAAEQKRSRGLSTVAEADAELEQIRREFAPVLGIRMTAGSAPAPALATTPPNGHGNGARPSNAIDAAVAAVAALGGPTRVADVAGKLGIESQAARVRLNRAADAGKILRLRKGLYAPVGFRPGQREGDARPTT